MYLWGETKQWNTFLAKSNLQTKFCLKRAFQKVYKHTLGKWSMAPNTERTISYNTWNSPLQHPNLEYKFDITGFYDNMPNTIF